jgi:hypothetical protein
MISNSVEWQHQRCVLIEQSNIESLPFSVGKDLFKLINSIDIRVNDLSKLEVIARSSGKITAEHKKILSEINDSIENFQQFVTFASILA